MEKHHPILPPFYVFGGLAIMLVLHFFLPGIRLIPMPWDLVGAALMVIGLALTISSAQTFHRSDTPVRPFEESTKLVTHGAFRFSRNPMYLGMVIVMVGTALLLGTLTPWLVPPVFVAIIQHFFIVPEEQLMKQTFGDQYRAYRGRVRRWL
jgi:protein-S-isoprenylcysteine O-methyltransferase Ste14